MSTEFLTGTLEVDQLPDGAMLDSEFTAATVLSLLDLTETELDDLLTGASLDGSTLTLRRNDAADITLTLPAAGESMTDGVVTAGAFNNDRTELTLTVDGADDVVINVPATLRSGNILAELNSDGTPPDADANQGKVVFSRNQTLQSINHGGHDKSVTFAEYGPTRAQPPTRSTNENNYGGSVAQPPHSTIGDYATNTVLWDRGSQVWLIKSSSGATRWSTYSGPLYWHHGDIYTNETVAARHVGSADDVGIRIIIYGHGSVQKPYMVTAFTAATDDVWQWDPIGVTLQDVEDVAGDTVSTHNEATDAHADIRTEIDTEISAHNTATDAHDDIRTEIDTEISTHNSSGTAHNDIRSDVSAVEDRLDALDGVEIEAYDSTATYSRGSANSIVTHSSGLFIYISSTERSSGHDPDTQPGYWLELSEGVAYEVISSGSHRIAARTLVVDGATDQVYLCTTTQTTPRDLTYIKAQADTIGGTFIELTAMIATTWKGPHVIGQDYEAGDRVTTNANTRIYTARVDTGETPPHADWIQTGPVGSGGGSDLAVQEEGTEVASAATSLNFTGTGATATAANGAVTVDIPGGQAGSLDDGSVTTAKLADGAVTTPKLADDAVTGAKIADDTIHGGALIDGTIATGKIGDDQVTGAKLSNNAVSTGKVADDAITQPKIADDAVDTDQLADEAVTAAKLAANAAGEGKVPIDNTMQFDGSGDLGVNTQRVVQTVSEWVQHFASGDGHDTSGHSGKYHEYTSSNTHRRIGSVEYHFDPENSSGNRTFQVFILELTGRNIDAILGSSEVYSGDALQHRFHFTDGVMINPNVRIGIGLHRTDGGNNEGLSVRAGAESQDSPRESYDDASGDFSFVGRFNHDRPMPSVNDTVGGTAANQIYGNPEIFYQIIHTHASLVGDGQVSASHLDSGSAADGTVATADGSGGVGYEALPDLADDTVTKAKLAADAKITANPSGTDGDDLERIDIGGTNYNLPASTGGGGGGGGGGGTSIGASIGTFRMVNSYTTSRMYATTVPTPAAADGDLLVITFDPDATSPDNAIGGSEVAFIPLDNLLAIPNAYTGTGSTDTEGSNRDGLRTGFGQNDWLYLGVTALTAGNLTIGSTDAKYAGVFTFRLLTYGTATPGSEQEDASVSPGENTFDETTINVPTDIWGYVNFGVVGDFRLGAWHRFLLADLTGLTDGTDNGAIDSGNALTFLADEETYFYLGQTSGDKVLVGSSRGELSPGTVRIRSN